MTKVSFCQNDPIIGESFWQKNSLFTLVFFELCLHILIFCQFANFGNQSLVLNARPKLHNLMETPPYP